MDISKVLKKERIVLNLKAQTKEDALRALTDVLYDTGALSDKEGFLSDVLAREAVSTTGIGNQIAIPHGKSSNVKETTVAIGRLQTETEWQSVDDKPVKLIVLLAVNENDKTGVSADAA